jgi:His-Xaa-Ser system protein HxsD
MNGLATTTLCEERLTLEIDLSIHPLEIVLRTCHAFTDRCFVFIRRTGEHSCAIDLAARANDARSLREIAGSFSSALLDAHLRSIVANETKAIRELLVAQAFCEADLLDRGASEADEHDDPRGITR